MTKTITLRNIKIQGIDATTLQDIQNAVMSWHDPAAGQYIITFDVSFSRQTSGDYALQLGAQKTDVPKGSVDTEMDAMVTDVQSLPGTMPSESEIYDQLAVA